MEVDSSLVEGFKQLNRETLEFDKKCATLAQEISSGQLTIVQLVEQLGAFLVDASPDNRELGTWILTQVLERLSPHQFDSTQLNFICAFYTDRLKDHYQVIPAVLSGILALAKFKEFPDGAATQILVALFHNVACQQQQEKDRYHIYKIFEIFLQKWTAELCIMGLDYVYGVLAAVDGERSPKNLMFLFHWFPTFLRKINLGHLTEEMFEVLSCYFPIDFKAPPQDTSTITRDTLANALAPCLAAIPEFAEFCFTLTLEKLDSSLEIAKLDSLKLLEIGCSSFDVSVYVQHSTEMWSQLQRQLFNKPSFEVEAACLSTLTAVVAKISADPSLNVTAKDIADTVKGNLFPDSRLFEPSSRLLLSVAAASQASCSLITKEIAPILINTFNITKTPAHQVAVLKILVDFFDTYVRLHEHVEFEELNKVPVLCLKASVDDNNSLKSVGLDSLSQISKFLSSDVRFSLYENFQILLLLQLTEEVRCSALYCLNMLAINYPVEVKEKFVDVVRSNEHLGGYFYALCAVAPQEYLTDLVIDIFLDCVTNESGLAQPAVNFLRHLIYQHEDNERIQSVLFEKNVVNILIDWGVDQSNYVDQCCLENLSFVVKTIVGLQSNTKQREIVEQKSLKILSLRNSRQLFVFLLDGLLCRLKLDVKIDYNILGDLTEVVCNETDACLQSVAGQLLANLINKCNDDNTLETYLNYCEQNINNALVLAWITKALMMRSHQKAVSWTNKMIELLSEDVRVATCFRIFMNDNFENLGNKSNCVKTLLYQQKFFTIISNRLNGSYRTGCDSYLVAFGYLLEHVPRQAVILQFTKILKLIVLCLDECDESEVLIILLQLIRDFIVSKSECFMDQYSIFLERFLKLSTFTKSMKVRVLALACLRQCTFSVQLYKLLPYKDEVLAVLARVLDDKKRMVRREAVEARTLWCLLDAPT